MKKIIVTGASGMLGSKILNNLLKKDFYEVTALTSKAKSLNKKYEQFSNVNVIDSIGDIDSSTMINAYLINCAFPRKNDGIELAKAIEFTHQLISKFSDFKGKLFINISTQSVYKQFGNEIVDEESNVSPSNLYSITKYALEESIKQSLNRNEYVNIRLGSLAAPEFEQRIINRFILRALEGKDIYIDRGPAKFSYLSIDDAAEAIISLINSNKLNYNLYNLGNQDYLLLKDLASLCVSIVKKHTGSGSSIIFKKEVSDYNNFMNSNRFFNEFEWKPSLKMVELCYSILDYYLEIKRN